MRKIIFISSLIFSMIFLSGNSFAQETKEDLYSFGGHVFADGLPVEYCTAQLFLVEDPDTPIDQVEFDILGYYYFYRKPAGQYFIKAYASPEDPNYLNYTPTYYPSGVYWGDAETIDLKEDNWEYDINLEIAEGLSEAGLGKLTGTIYYDENKSIAEGISILLLDSESNLLQHIVSDEYGTFTFSHLPLGDYVVFPVITGFITHPINFTITDDHMIFSDIQITIKNGMISSYINEALIAENSFLFFPNPSSNYVNIQFETKGYQEIQTRVLDLSGRLVFESTSKRTSTYNNRIETSDWQNGYYFIEVLVNGEKAITQKMAVIH